MNLCMPLWHPMLASAEWKKAQRADGDFVTEYARDRPNKEDMAESALFAWAILFYPGRLPDFVEEEVRRIMPNRIFHGGLLWQASALLSRWS